MYAYFSKRPSETALAAWLRERFDAADAAEAVEWSAGTGDFGVEFALDAIDPSPTEAPVEHLEALCGSARVEAVVPYGHGHTHVHIDAEGTWDVLFDEEAHRIRGPRATSEQISSKSPLPEDFFGEQQGLAANRAIRCARVLPDGVHRSRRNAARAFELARATTAL